MISPFAWWSGRTCVRFGVCFRTGVRRTGVRFIFFVNGLTLLVCLVTIGSRRKTMEERYDIRPSQKTAGHWTVIDTGNNNCPVKECPDHASALRTAIRMDKGL